MTGKRLAEQAYDGLVSPPGRAVAGPGSLPMAALVCLVPIGLDLRPAIVFVPLASFSIARGFALGMTLPLDNTDSPDEANTWNAPVITTAYLIAATGPFLVGGLRDFTGGFGASLRLLAGVALAMLLFTPFLQPRRDAEPDGTVRP